MATVPNAVLRYAGLWDAAVIYSWADFVVSPINSFCYANGNANRTPTIGGSDPSVQPSNTWALMPNGGGGGGGGITSLNGLDSGDNTGILTLVSADGSVTFTTPTPSTGQIDASVTYPTVVSQLNGLTGSVSLTSPLNTITIGVTGNDIELEVTNPPVPPIVVEVGKYTETTGGLSTATITASTCDNASIIQITYIHTGGGGGAQYIKSITPNIGSFTVVTNTAIDIGDEINWMVSVN